jgi:tetratricopeptide (TPR) repeat protein
MSEKSVPELISSLLDKSLLQRVINQDEIFYTVLVTIQDFARQRLRKRGEETEVRNWHLAYFLDLAEQADKELHGPHQLTWIHRLEVMRDNLRVALEWAIETGQIETVLRMARKLHWFWFMLGDFTEGRQWLGRALQMSGAVAYPEAQAEALIQLATHIVIQTGNKEARPFVEQGLSIARAQKDTHQTAWALDILGLVLRNEEKFPAAKSAFEESKHLFQEVHDDWGSSHALMCLGLLSWREEEWATALSLSQQALAGFQELGDRYFQCVTLRHVGRAYVHLSDFTNGIAALQESLILAQQFHSKYELGQTLWQFAEAATYGDQPARAICLYQAAKNILGHIGVWQQADDMEVENQLAACRAALSEFAFAEAVEQCRSMTLEQAITYALKWSASE